MKAPRAGSVFVTALLTLFFCGIKLSDARPESRSDDGVITFVYIHGFGGEKEAPQFCDNMRGFLAGTNNRSRVVNYRWDSGKVDPPACRGIVAKLTEACRSGSRAVQEGNY